MCVQSRNKSSNRKARNIMTLFIMTLLISKACNVHKSRCKVFAFGSMNTSMSGSFRKPQTIDHFHRQLPNNRDTRARKRCGRIEGWVVITRRFDGWQWRRGDAASTASASIPFDNAQSLFNVDAGPDTNAANRVGGGNHTASANTDTTSEERASAATRRRASDATDGR